MDDTIAAIATAYGEGGIGIVRISGSNALEILETIFVPRFSQEKSIEKGFEKNLENRKMTYGHIVNPGDGTVVDEVLSLFMKGPHTYTREDVVEINCHGSMVSLRRTLELALKYGARLAEPGEFTKRAFLNGRLDLSQAEAVIDLIKAKTDKCFDVAMEQLEGSLSEEIKKIRAKMMDLLVNVAVNIDYPDEDIEELTYGNLENEISQLVNMIEKLLDTAESGRMLREGLKVAIIGKPNVGKSSVMNRLLKENRAIVTDVPGTTRDTIEEAMSINDIPVSFTDTAGIRDTDDKIEKMGIEKSKKSFNEADLILFVMDSSREISAEDERIMEYIGSRRCIVLANKIDLGTLWKGEIIQKKLPQATIFETSMVEGTGVERIEQEIFSMVASGTVRQNESLFVTNVRHKDLLERAKKSLEDAANMTAMREAMDFIEVDVKSSYDFLGEIIGETVSDDIVNEVFSRFCLGK